MLTPLPPLRRSIVAAAMLAALSFPALAAPDYAPIAPTDAATTAAAALDRFLVDKGLMPPMASAAVSDTPQPALVERMRHQASDMVVTAMNFLGVPYRRGGNTAESGFDCSGFTRQVFETSLGLVLPRRAEQQAKAPGLQPVKRTELQPGDLVFFNTLKRTFSHVGIYVGEGKFIHAPKPGGEVRVESMDFAYWAKRFTGGRRAESAPDASPPTAAVDPATLLNASVNALRPSAQTSVER